MAQRRLTQADHDAWSAYVEKTAEKRTSLNVSIVSSIEDTSNIQRGLLNKRAQPVFQDVPLSFQEPPPGVDTPTWARLRKTKLRSDQKLDLHGQSIQRAFELCQSFIQQAYARDLRLIEIITGRGSGSSGGGIRKELIHWISLPRVRHMVVAAAHTNVRNTGSVRLLLRRPPHAGREKPSRSRSERLTNPETG